MLNNSYNIGLYYVEIYDDPLKNLSRNSQEELIKNCLPLARNSFGEKYTDEDIVKLHIFNTSTTVIIRNEFSQVVGAAGSSIINIDDYMVIYFQGAIISKECRVGGLHKFAVAARIMTEIGKINENYVNKKKVLIGGRTQNPLVYKFYHRKLGMFPYTNGHIDKEIKHISKKLAMIIHDEYSDFKYSNKFEFDDNVLVSRNSLRYISNGKEKGLNLYGNSIPFCKDDKDINQYMRENLDWNNGDALIMLGYYDPHNVAALLQGQNIRLNPFVEEKVPLSLALTAP